MKINAITDATAVKNSANIKNPGQKEQQVQANAVGYIEKEQAPTNANLYKAMYGVNDKASKEEEQNKYVEQLAEVRAKYEMDVDDKNREIANNKAQEQNPKANEEKSYYEQYLEYKHKYE
ncbi:MAG: hypothetical protein ACI37T_03785 [Candidatus Gastranaerophilaceae bacterium]